MGRVEAAFATSGAAWKSAVGLQVISLGCCIIHSLTHKPQAKGLMWHLQSQGQVRGGKAGSSAVLTHPWSGRLKPLGSAKSVANAPLPSHLLQAAVRYAAK